MVLSWFWGHHPLTQAQLLSPFYTVTSCTLVSSGLAVIQALWVIPVQALGVSCRLYANDLKSPKT